MRSYITPLLCGAMIVGSATALPSQFGSSKFKSRGHSDDSCDVVSCLESKNVPYSVEGSADWTNLSTPFNLRLIYTPAVITIPTTEDQVSDSVICAAEANLKVQAKGGGHSYASFSSGGKDGSAVIEMRAFDEITVDQTTFIAKIGAGQRLGNIAQALYDQGQRALPHGTCPGVGIGGHATHGGYGHTSRLWGLTLDHIIGLDLVLANGTQIHASEDCYPEIFWAMRGAAESIGIVTYFYFATEPAPSSMVFFTAVLTASWSSVDTVTNAFLGLQSWVLTSPYVTSSLSFGMYTDTGGAFSITGLCTECDVDEFRDTIFSDMLKSFPSPSGINVTEMSYMDAVITLAAPQPLSQSLTNYDLHDTFYAKSIVTKMATPLTSASVSAFWTYHFNHQSQGPYFTIINLYGGSTSAINAVTADATAYSDRDALWVFQNYGYTANNQPPFPDSTIGLVDGINDAVENADASAEFTAYLNYVDPNYSPAEAAREYYGAETYDRLFAVKMDVDPMMTFWNPLSVGTTPIF